MSDLRNKIAALLVVLGLGGLGGYAISSNREARPDHDAASRHPGDQAHGSRQAAAGSGAGRQLSRGATAARRLASMPVSTGTSGSRLEPPVSTGSSGSAAAAERLPGAAAAGGRRERGRRRRARGRR